MKPCASMAARISSPIGPSSTRRMCSVDLNRKGSEGTIVAGTMLLNGATLTRTMSSAPIFVCSIVSFSEPSVLWPNTFTLFLPPLRSLMSLPMYMTACTVG